MPKITDDKEGEFLERVRAIIVRRPDISIRQIKKVLAENPKEPISLDKEYLARLVSKIRKNRAQRLNHYTVNVILGQFEEEARELKKTLWAIIGNPIGDEKVKVSAIKELRNTSVALFDKMFTAGLFEYNHGKLEVEHTLSPDAEAMIERAIQHGYGKGDTTNSEEPSAEDSTG